MKTDMSKKSRAEKIKELSSMIIDLKTNTMASTKKTIQKLQQKLDKLINEQRTNN